VGLAAQTAGPGSLVVAWHANPGSAHNPHGTKGGTGVPRERRHTNLGNTDNPRSTAKRRTLRQRGQAVRWNKCTQALQHRGQALGTETSAHKLCNTEGELRGLREDHTSLHNAKGARQDPHKHQSSKLQPAVQGRTGEYKHRQ